MLLFSKYHSLRGAETIHETSSGTSGALRGHFLFVHLNEVDFHKLTFTDDE